MANTFQTVVHRLQGTTQDVYTCPVSTTAILFGLTLSHVDDTDANQYTCDVLLNDGTNARHMFPNGLEIPSQGGWAADNKYVLEAGDKVQMVADTADKIDATLAILEIT